MRGPTGFAFRFTMLGVFVFLLTGAAMAACCLAFATRRPLAARSVAGLMALGVAAQYLLALPAGFVQAAAYVAADGPRARPFAERLLVAPLAAPFNAGGYTCRLAFEAVSGPPRGVILGDKLRLPSPVAAFPLYATPLLLQLAAVAWGFAALARPKSGGPPDRLALAGLGAVVLVNSFANVAWPWWTLDAAARL